MKCQQARALHRYLEGQSKFVIHMLLCLFISSNLSNEGCIPLNSILCLNCPHSVPFAVVFTKWSTVFFRRNSREILLTMCKNEGILRLQSYSDIWGENEYNPQTIYLYPYSWQLATLKTLQIHNVSSDSKREKEIRFGLRATFENKGSQIAFLALVLQISPVS